MTYIFFKLKINIFIKLIVMNCGVVDQHKMRAEFFFNNHKNTGLPISLIVWYFFLLLFLVELWWKQTLYFFINLLIKSNTCRNINSDITNTKILPKFCNLIKSHYMRGTIWNNLLCFEMDLINTHIHIHTQNKKT